MEAQQLGIFDSTSNRFGSTDGGELLKSLMEPHYEAIAPMSDDKAHPTAGALAALAGRLGATSGPYSLRARVL